MGEDFISRRQQRVQNRRATIEPENFQLWDIHSTAWSLFQKLRKQFQIVGMGSYYGIPIPTKESLFNIELIPLEDRSQLLEEIELIEDGALQVLNTKDE